MNLLKLEQLLRIIFAFLSFGGRNIYCLLLSLPYLFVKGKKGAGRLPLSIYRKK